LSFDSDSSINNPSSSSTTIVSYSDFLKVDMRVGKIIECRDFPAARKPAYQLRIDFGQPIGIKESSAQITVRYKKDELIGKKIIAVVNFPPKKIANFNSEVLVLGVPDKNSAIILLEPENAEDAMLGSRVY
jgi:tRNA-binding protein